MEISSLPERSWAAGFYDGEGCTSLSDKKYPIISIVQNDPEVLIKFCQVVGLGYVKYLREMKNGTELFEFKANGYERVQQIICILWEHLSGPKRAQAERVLHTSQVYFRNPDYVNGTHKRPKMDIRSLDSIIYPVIEG